MRLIKALLIICLMMASLMGCGPDIEAIRQEKDSAKLYAIAEKHPDGEAGRAAVETLLKLGEVDTLKKLALESPDEKARWLAVDNLPDAGDARFVLDHSADKKALGEKLAFKWKFDLDTVGDDALVVVACYSVIRSTRADAFRKIKDPMHRLEVVRVWSLDKHGIGLDTRDAVNEYLSTEKGGEDPVYLAISIISNLMPKRAVKTLEKLDDQKLLAMIINSGQDDYVKYHAVGKLDDQELLCEIARRKPGARFSAKAVKRIQDLKCLEQIARDASLSVTARVGAVEKLENQQLLAELALNDENSAVRRSALNKLDDQDAVWHLANNDKDKYIRKTAVRKLLDPGRLYEIARNDTNPEVVDEAFKAIGSHVRHGKLDGFYSRGDRPYGVLSTLLHEPELVKQYGEAKLKVTTTYTEATYKAVGSAGCTMKREFVKIQVLSGKKVLWKKNYKGDPFPHKITKCNMRQAHVDLKEIFTALLKPLDEATRNKLTQKYL